MNKLSKIPGKRIISLLILFLILVGLCIYYYDNFMAHQEYPSLGVVVNNYPEGNMVSVSGTVTETFDNGFYMQDNYQGKTVTFKVYTDSKVRLGDKSQVLGVLGSDYQITPSKMIIIEKWSYDFLLLRSLIALFFLVFIFNRYWRFDFTNYEFVRRR